MYPSNSLQTIRPINPEAFGPPAPPPQQQMPGGPPPQGGFNAEQYLLNKVMALKKSRGRGSGALGNLMAAMPTPEGG